MTAPLKIEKGIPIPPKSGVQQSMLTMEIGDSFLSATQGGLFTVAQRAKIRITTRRETKNGVKWFRVWRIE